MSTSRLRFATATVLLIALSTSPAFAVNKDMIQLQTQMQQLQDAVARLQQSNDERMGVLKDLVQQTADSVNKMSVAIDGMKLQVQNSQDANAAKADQVSGQIQSLNDTLDELKARMSRLEKATGDIQGQLSTISGTINNLPQPTGAAAPDTTAAPPTTAPPAASTPPPAAVTKPAPGKPVANAASPKDLYNVAFGDFLAAKYPLATSEFTELATAYPDDTLSGNAYFYIGEIDLRTTKLSLAVRAYDHVIEHFPDNNKVPAAHLHKAEALIQMKETPQGARELQALIQRFPNSPEAAQARTKLAALPKTAH